MASGYGIPRHSITQYQAGRDVKSLFQLPAQCRHSCKLRPGLLGLWPILKNSKNRGCTTSLGDPAQCMTLSPWRSVCLDAAWALVSTSVPCCLSSQCVVLWGFWQCLLSDFFVHAQGLLLGPSKVFSVSGWTRQIPQPLLTGQVLQPLTSCWTCPNFLVFERESVKLDLVF